MPVCLGLFLVFSMLDLLSFLPCLSPYFLVTAWYENEITKEPLNTNNKFTIHSGKLTPTLFHLNLEGFWNIFGILILFCRKAKQWTFCFLILICNIQIKFYKINMHKAFVIDLLHLNELYHEIQFSCRF